VSAPRPPYVGDPGTFEQVVHDLVLNPDVQTLRLAGDWLAARGPEGFVLVVRVGLAKPEEVEELVERLREPGVTIVFAGWTRSAAVPAIEALPWTRFAWVEWLHVDEDGSIWPDHPATRAEWLHGWLSRRPRAAPDWERFWAAVEQHRSTLRTVDEGFSRRLAANPPWATRILVGAMVAIFAVEMAVGAPDDNVAMWWMGALERQSVLSGQVWRVLTAPMLHANVPHAAMNLFVLWRVGNLLERILGTARFLVIYVVAAIGGSLLSLLLLNGFSVGASGAIWGLMAAQFVLSLRDNGVLPEGLRKAMRSSSGQNLMLNLLVAFMPGIDWAAHGGGGLAGAGAALLVGASLAPVAPEPAPAAPPAPFPIRLAAGFAAFLLIAAAAITLVGAAISVLVPAT